MKEVEEFLNGKNLLNSDEIEDFLELSDYTRELISNGEYGKVGELVKTVLSSKYFEAFSWVTSILQEKYGDEKCNIKDFSCNLGRKIDNYDEFTNVLGIDPEPYTTTMKTITGKDGEIQSFYNILILKTNYTGTYLVSMENFDTKDNDFIQYKLLFTKDIDKYIKKMENCDKFSEKEDHVCEL